VLKEKLDAEVLKENSDTEDIKDAEDLEEMSDQWEEEENTEREVAEVKVFARKINVKWRRILRRFGSSSVKLDKKKAALKTQSKTAKTTPTDEGTIDYI